MTSLRGDPGRERQNALAFLAGISKPSTQIEFSRPRDRAGAEHIDVSALPAYQRESSRVCGRRRCCCRSPTAEPLARRSEGFYDAVVATCVPGSLERFATVWRTRGNDRSHPADRIQSKSDRYRPLRGADVTDARRYDGRWSLPDRRQWIPLLRWVSGPRQRSSDGADPARFFVLVIASTALCSIKCSTDPHGIAGVDAADFLAPRRAGKACGPGVLAGLVDDTARRGHCPVRT